MPVWRRGRAARLVAVLVASLLVTPAVAPAAAGAAPAPPSAPGTSTSGGPAGDSWIIPGQRIGPYRLGMTMAQVAAVPLRLGCVVRVFFAARVADRLETNCGGAYKTPELVTVGITPLLVWRAYGRPDQVLASPAGDVRGEWLRYTGLGIAFRVVYGDNQTALIQAIAVFRGTLPYRPGEVTPPPLGPPPSIGE